MPFKTSAAPLRAKAGRHFGARSYVRPLTGMATVLGIAAVIVISALLFRGDLVKTVPVTVISDRAGLVLNPDARVKMRGVQVGHVEAIESRPDGTAAIHLALAPGELANIPANVLVDITSTTVFGAKYIQLLPPENPVAERLRPGQTLVGQQVTVETNTIFQQLTGVLERIEPMKLNAILSALSRGFSGRGPALGETVDDLNALFSTVNPALPNLRHDLATAPAVMAALADAAPDFVTIVDRVTEIGRVLVEQENSLDAFLVSAAGLGEVGNDVLTANRGPLTGVVKLLVPTTGLLHDYNRVLDCTLQGLVPLTKAPPLPVPGVYTMAGLMPGRERYRYPRHLPKVNADVGPEVCEQLGLPRLKPGEIPPFVVTDVGANPWEYGNRNIVLNSDGLKQMLFGPIDGPPRNTSQTGMPG